MNKIIFVSFVLLLLMLSGTCFAVEVSVGEAVTTTEELKGDEGPPKFTGTPVFGANFFRGRFSQTKLPSFDPDYRISIGDTVGVRAWGAIELQADIPVDTQGNIFLPHIGTVSVAGLPNAKLVPAIEGAVKRKYRENVFVYATIAGYQPVSVFVTGNVNRPGLYQGMSSDSVIQFLDKAAGIDPWTGSFRRVRVIRSGKVVKNLDLYDFLTTGRVDLFQFRNGDSVVVENRLHQVEVQGDVGRPFRFEFFEGTIPLSQVLGLALPLPAASNVTITSWGLDNISTVRSYRLDDISDVLVGAGDLINVYADHNLDTSTITVSGEHDGPHTTVLDRNASLGLLLRQTPMSPYSKITAVQVFRRSVAEKQKQLLSAKLDELESLVLTTGAVTKDEALMRSQEAESVLKFIDRARKLEPKGQVVINEGYNLNEFILEDEDTVFIPRKSSLVLVQGEVSFPGAHTWAEGMTMLDYIELAGDFSERANEDRVLLIRQNGRVVKCDSSRDLKKTVVQSGDAILVMPRMEGKHLQITKDVTQILYQIAVTTGVLLAL